MDQSFGTIGAMLMPQIDNTNTTLYRVGIKEDVFVSTKPVIEQLGLVCLRATAVNLDDLTGRWVDSEWYSPQGPKKYHNVDIMDILNVHTTSMVIMRYTASKPIPEYSYIRGYAPDEVTDVINHIDGPYLFTGRSNNTELTMDDRVFTLRAYPTNVVGEFKVLADNNLTIKDLSIREGLGCWIGISQLGVPVFANSASELAIVLTSPTNLSYRANAVHGSLIGGDYNRPLIALMLMQRLYGRVSISVVETIFGFPNHYSPLVTAWLNNTYLSNDELDAIVKTLPALNETFSL